MTREEVAAVAELDAGLLDVDARDLSDEALGAHIAALEVLVRRAQAAQALAVRVFEVRDAADAAGCPSTKAWLCAAVGLAEREAGSLVALGRSMDRMPALAAAFADGAATATHVRMAAAASRPLAADTVAAGDQLLAASARLLDTRRFGEVVRRWVSRVAPGDFERDTEKKYDSRWFSASETFGGMVSLQGMLDPQAGALLSDAVAALVAANAPDDVRTADQQRADALTDLVAVATGHTSWPGAVRPEVVVHVTADALAGLPGAPNAEVDGAGPVPAATFDRLACDARWRRLLVDAVGVPVELGRVTRDVPPALRKFVALRDSGCRYPGCVRGPSFCEAHHAVFWRHGGTTDAANLVLLCRYHHHLVHERRHDLKLLPDATVKVTRPNGTVLTGTPRGTPAVARL